MKKKLLLSLFVTPAIILFVLFSPAPTLAVDQCPGDSKPPKEFNVYKEEGGKIYYPSGNIPIVLRLKNPSEDQGILNDEKKSFIRLETRLRASLVFPDGETRGRCEFAGKVVVNSLTMDARFNCELTGDKDDDPDEYNGKATVLLQRTFFDIRKMWDPDEEICEIGIPFWVSKEFFNQRLGANSKCGTGNTGIATALGCIPAEDIGGFISTLLRIVTGFGGGIALILIISAGFTIATSTGNPDKLKEGQEQLTSAITGLILIVLAVFLLEVIGAGILELPGITN